MARLPHGVHVLDQSGVGRIVLYGDSAHCESWLVGKRPKHCRVFHCILPIAAAGAVVLLLGSKNLYTWLDPKVVATDAIIQGKSAYLNATGFTIRMVIAFAVWLVFAKLIVGNSLKQDQDGDAKMDFESCPAFDRLRFVLRNFVLALHS
jgi:hypothetical protein